MARDIRLYCDNSILLRKGPLEKLFLRRFDKSIHPLVPITGYKRAEKIDWLKHMANLLVQGGLSTPRRPVRDSRDFHKRDTRLKLQVWKALIDAGLAIIERKGSEMGGQTRYRATSKLLQLDPKWEQEEMFQPLEHKKNTQLAKPTADAPVLVKSGKRDPETKKLLPKSEQKKLLPLSPFLLGPYSFNGLQGLDALTAMENSNVYKTGRTPENADEYDHLILCIMHSDEYVRAQEKRIDRFNDMLLKNHTWVAYSVDPETNARHPFQPYVRQRLVHSNGQLYFGGMRLYGKGILSGQKLPKEVRKHMLIDGQTVAELDFSCLHTRMAYHILGMDPKGDLYRPEQVFPRYWKSPQATDEGKEVLRDFVKMAMIRCWNVASQGSAANSIRGLLRTNHEVRHLCKTVELIDAVDIVERIRDAHPDLKGQLFENKGLRLMSNDALLMLEIIAQLTPKNIPVLAIHDSLVCKVSDVGMVHFIMVVEYDQRFHFMPDIHRVY